MIEKLYHIPFTFFFLCFIALPASAQDVDIVPYLKQIESGDKQEAVQKLPALKSEYPNSPSVMFLEGVLTENGEDAVAIYSKIVNSYPGSKYADAALYRVYSYYFALGFYETAKEHLNKLQKNYPESPYIKIAERNIPSEDEFTSTQLRDNKVDKTDDDKKEPVVQPAGKYNFTIQAGAFSKLSNAHALRDDFKDSGFFTEIKEKIVGGTAFHVVFVGQFNSEEDAKNFLQVINREYKLDGRVLKLD
jgi:cell division septation protein DedD